MVVKQQKSQWVIILALLFTGCLGAMCSVGACEGLEGNKLVDCCEGYNGFQPGCSWKFNCNDESSINTNYPNRQDLCALNNPQNKRGFGSVIRANAPV
jgi:hypothetical protein